MSCIAFVPPQAQQVCVTEDNDCTQFTRDFSILNKEIECAVVEGVVTCATTGAVVPNAIVKVTGVAPAPAGPFFGVTNEDGFYAICIPTPEDDEVEWCFNVTVLCCSPDLVCCEDADCNCGCSGAPA